MRPTLGSTTTVLTGTITNTMLRPAVAYSVIGQPSSAMGPVSDIRAPADRTVLARDLGAVAFVPYENIFDPAADPFLAANRTREPKCCVYSLVTDPIHAGLASDYRKATPYDTVSDPFHAGLTADYQRAVSYDAVTDPFAGALRG